jgi:predicted dehydrogenase
MDVLIIGTSDHWHALITIKACKEGKDIYQEKPLTFTIKEGKEVVHAVRSHRRVPAVGNQQRLDPNFQHAVRTVRKGAIGKLKKGKCQCVIFPGSL